MRVFTHVRKGLPLLNGYMEGKHGTIVIPLKFSNGHSFLLNLAMYISKGFPNRTKQRHPSVGPMNGKVSNLQQK